jgi:hypothetical protein
MPYVCSYSITNNVDPLQDTHSITGLHDTVQAASGPVNSGNVISLLKFEIGAPGFFGVPTCNGTGTGTPADPFRNATMCTLPFGSRLNVQPFSFYEIALGDYDLPGHVVTDTASLTWHDLCDGPPLEDEPPCSLGTALATASSETLVST